jgi:hypothetical protein
MRRLCATLLAVTLLSAPFYAHAQGYHLLGIGTLSCGSWTAARAQPKSTQAYMDTQWVLGFLSDVGYMGPGLDPLNGTDAEGVFAWLDNYCHAHPLDLIHVAADAFVSAHPK